MEAIVFHYNIMLCRAMYRLNNMKIMLILMLILMLLKDIECAV